MISLNATQNVKARNAIKIKSSLANSSNNVETQNKQISTKASHCTLNNQVSFGSFWSFLKPKTVVKTSDIAKIIRNRELRKLNSFKQLEEFLKENNFNLLIDGSRKEYKAKPYYFAEIENLGWLDNKAHGWGNTHEETVSNLIQDLAASKSRGIELLDIRSGKQFQIPAFSEADLQKIDTYRRFEFEKFRNK